MQKNNPTSKEHYIPKVYLKGFASDDERIYFYDLNTRLYSKVMVPIRTICYEKDLYEYRNSNNEIVLTNRIENVLGALEEQFSKYKNSIRTRIMVADSHTRNFLSEDEVLYWLTYITLQILRLPKIIDAATAFFKEIIPANGDDNLHRNAALYVLLPCLKQLEPNSIETKLFDLIIKGIGSMRVTVAYDEKHRIFTSDSPIFTYTPAKYTPSQRITNCEKVIFPIDESLCLIFSRNGLYPDNGIILIDDREFEIICKSIAYAADEKLFTKRKFTKQEKEWIRIAVIDKRND